MDVDLGLVLGDLESMRSGIAAEKSREAELLTKLQMRIRQGESTGDIIRDYSILNLSANREKERKS